MTVCVREVRGGAQWARQPARHLPRHLCRARATSYLLRYVSPTTLAPQLRDRPPRARSSSGAPLSPTHPPCTCAGGEGAGWGDGWGKGGGAGEASGAHHDDIVAMHHGLEAVSNGQHGDVVERRPQRFLDELVRLEVDGRGRPIDRLSPFSSIARPSPSSCVVSDAMPHCSSTRRRSRSASMSSRVCEHHGRWRPQRATATRPRLQAGALESPPG